jgi:hypothetical protein
LAKKVSRAKTLVSLKVSYAPKSQKRLASQLVRFAAISKDACVLRQPKEKSLGSAKTFPARRGTAAVLGRNYADPVTPEPGAEIVFTDSEAPFPALCGVYL